MNDALEIRIMGRHEEGELRTFAKTLIDEMQERHPDIVFLEITGIHDPSDTAVFMARKRDDGD